MVFINIPKAYPLLWHVYLRRFSSVFCNVLYCNEWKLQMTKPISM